MTRQNSSKKNLSKTFLRYSRSMNKKGMSMTVAVQIILIVVVFIIILPFLFKILLYSVNYAKGGVCQASANSAALKSEYACIDIVESPFTLTCPRRTITIGTENAVVLQGGKETEFTVREVQEDNQVLSYATYETLVGETVDAIVAQELSRCWNQFGLGESVLLNTGVEGGVGDSYTDKTACFVCSTILFSDAVQKEHADTNTALIGSDLRQYLIDKNIPGEKKTFFEELNNPRTICEDFIKEKGPCWGELEKYYTMTERQMREYFNQNGGLGDDVDDAKWAHYQDSGIVTKIGPLNTATGFAVVYVRKRFDFCQADRSEQKNADAELSNFAYVVPLNEVSSLCDAIVI